MQKPLSKEEAAKRYAKYFYRENAKLPSETLMAIEAIEMPAQAVLERRNANRLLESGYHEVETGYRKNKNGSVYVAALTKMPYVTAKMLDWWFWWHPMESLRYKIWYPDAHFGTSADFQGVYEDENLSHAEKLHKSAHTVIEDVGTGTEKLLIDFMSPSEFGFEVSKFKAGKVATIICAKVASLKEKVWITEMCHFVRETPEGVEMRSRFWIGHQLKRMNTKDNSFINKIINQPFIKKRLLPKDIGKHLMYHCVQEYHNLAAFLPELYAEEGNL